MFPTSQSCLLALLLILQHQQQFTLSVSVSLSISSASNVVVNINDLETTTVRRQPYLRRLQPPTDIFTHDNGNIDATSISVLVASRDDSPFANDQNAVVVTAAAARQSTSACILTSAGFYGQLNRNMVPVSFVYQASIRASDQVVQTSILPAMEQSITQGLLPLLFTECGAGRRRRNRRNLQQQTGIVGISSQSADSLSTANAVPCTFDSTDGFGGQCYTIQGIMTAFVQDGVTETQVQDTLLPLIERYVASGDLLAIDPRIQRVGLVARDGQGSLTTMPPLVGEATPVPLATQTPTRAPIPGEIRSTPVPIPVPVPAPVPNTPFTFSPTRVPTSSSTGFTFAPVSLPGLEPGAPVDVPTVAPTLAPNSLGKPPIFPNPPVLTTPLPTLPFGVTANPAASSTPTSKPSEIQPRVTEAPTRVGLTEDDDEQAGSINRSESKSGIDKMEWWAWLLVAIGAVALLACCLPLVSKLCCAGGEGRSDKETVNNNEPESAYGGSNGDNAYVPPGDASYVPPGMGEFNVTPDPPAPTVRTTSVTNVPTILTPSNITSTPTAGNTLGVGGAGALGGAAAMGNLEPYGDEEEEGTYEDEGDEDEYGEGDDTFEEDQGTFENDEFAGEYEDGEEGTFEDDEEGEGEYEDNAAGEYGYGEEQEEGTYEDDEQEGEFEEDEEFSEYEEETIGHNSDPDRDGGNGGGGAAANKAPGWGQQYSVGGGSY